MSRPLFVGSYLQKRKKKLLRMITVFILLLLYTNNAAKFYHSHYRKEHKDMLASFGLTEDSNFPTAAFLPVKRSSSNSLVINIIYFKIFTY